MHALTRPFAFLLAVIVALVFVVYYSGVAPPDGQTDRYAVLGTWTEEGGEPGNSIHIYLVRTSVPNRWGIECWEGHIDFRRQFGKEDFRTTWNFGSTRPLILNVAVPGQRITAAAVRVLDRDHLLVRFGDDFLALERPDAFQYPDVKTFKRVR